MDSHADTCCAGKNFRLLVETGDTCDVHPFSDHFDAIKNIQIATCVTLITTSNGYSFILVGHEMLFFGADMERSLLNPNQLRHNGVVVQDDYTRYDEPLGITIGDVFIPFEMQGTTIYFDSRTPTDNEIETLPHLVLTRDEPWNPSEVELRPVIIAVAGAGTYQPQRYETDIVLSGVHTTCHEHTIDKRIIASARLTQRYRNEVDNELDKVDDKSLHGQVTINATTSKERHTKFTPETLSKTWKIGLDTATKTLQVTTQRGVRTAMHPIQRRYRVDHLDLHRTRLNTMFHVDMLFAKTKSLRGNLCATVFTDSQYTAVYPAENRTHAGQALADFSQDVGIPDYLTADLAGEFSGPNTEFMRHVRQLRIQMHWAEKARHKQNHRVEREIQTLKARWRRRMIDRSIPTRLWDYGLIYESEILSRMSRGSDGRTGYERLTGQTPDISEWLDFEFYDLVWFHNQEKPTMNDESRRLGRWLGVSHRIGSDLCYWILTDSGQVISCATVQHVTVAEAGTDEIKAAVEQFVQTVNERLSDIGHVQDTTGQTTAYIEDIPEEIVDTAYIGIVPSDAEYGQMMVEGKPDVDDIEMTETYDKYIGAKLMMEVGDQQLQGKVVKRARMEDGTPIGRQHANPLFDTRAYMVEFPLGTQEKYEANIIAQNMYEQIDAEGKSYSLMKEISNHAKDGTAIPINEGFTITRNGIRLEKKTTRGWKLLVEWKDGSSTWVPLVELKDSNPIEVAEYAVANQIDHKPAFAWWVNTVLSQQQRIISKVQKKYWRTTHKYGIKLPHTAIEALKIDVKTNTNHWSRAIEKELSKVKVAWKVRDDLMPETCREGKQLIGYTEIKCHMIFDVKMDFTRKARFVAGGHLTEAPSGITYSSVVSRDSVRLAFLYAELNGLDVMVCDIGNAYLNAPCREKVWFVGGIEVGNDAGHVLEITRALYGLKSSGASWRLMLSQTLLDLGFVGTRADPDAYRRLARKPDGTEYYELLMVYVDDILMVSHDPKATIDKIGEVYEIKEGSAGAPSTYLGAQVYRHSLPDGRSAWAMSSEKYAKNAVRTVKELLREDGEGCHLKSTASVPYPTSYKPELDMSEPLDEDLMSRYKQLIGILRWMVELGRLDIYLELSLLSHYLAAPRIGHLEAVYHIFAYVKTNNKSSIVLDCKHVRLDESAFANVPMQSWHEFYGEVAEEIPPDMPVPKGNAVSITCFVDADHAGNVVTRRSQTGILIYVNNAPIVWHSKKQNTVESSSFGSEFVALRTARNMIVALRYKLRMFGIPIMGAASVLCDNQGVVKNTSLPESALSKRHNAINYHAVREAVAAGIIRVGKEDGVTNLADVFTKVLGKNRRYELFNRITYKSTYRVEPEEDGQPKLVS